MLISIRFRSEWSGEEWIETHTGILYYDTASRSFLIRRLRSEQSKSAYNRATFSGAIAF